VIKYNGEKEPKEMMKNLLKLLIQVIPLALFLVACSNPVEPLPPVTSAPTGVSASPGNRQVTVTWDPVSGADSYNIYWSTSSGVSKTSYTKRISGVSSPYAHTGLTNGTKYYYVVTAENSADESDESSKVSATPSLAPPPAP